MAKNDKPTNAEAKAIKLPCGITQEQLNAWKEQYGAENIKHVKVFEKAGDKEHFKSLVVRKPDLEVITKASRFAAEPFKAGLIIYNECKLAVDPEIEANDELKAGALVNLTRMFKIHESEVSDL